MDDDRYPDLRDTQIEQQNDLIAKLRARIEELEMETADLSYGGLLVHDENVDLLDQLDALEVELQEARARIAELEEKHLLPMTVDGTDAFETTAGETGVPIVKAEISGPNVWAVNDGVQ